MSESKKLYRSKRERMIAGVCGGIAEYFNADPTIVRLAVTISVLIPALGGASLLAYLVMWVIVPEDPVL